MDGVLVLKPCGRSTCYKQTLLSCLICNFFSESFGNIRLCFDNFYYKTYFIVIIIIKEVQIHTNELF